MYEALYRKWRPLSFDDVISQPHITKTLKNQITSGRTAHAYLFTGSRGTGKTTCARIFAKAVNCPQCSGGNPCLECSICHDADSFALSDIIEIDAASNNGVNDIRDLRDGAVYTPERCKYKIYIIDEVHMLSASAFNALLKIMEEPPEYVKFILATTEIHKVPATIVSRCQRFDFRRIKPEDIATRLLYVAQHEDFKLDEKAAALIARLSDGGMRDALSLLDLCASYSPEIGLETVSSAAGIAGRDSLFEIMEAAVGGNAGDALAVADRLYSMSKDMQRLCSELTDQFRNVMLIKAAPENKNMLACMPDEIERLTEIAEKISLPDVLSKLTVLQDCSERMGKALSKRVELEMCLIRLCSAQSSKKSIDNPPEHDKIKQAERAPIQKQTAALEKQPVQTAPEEKKKPSAADFRPLIQWSGILDELTKICPSLGATLIDSVAYASDSILLIDAKNRFFLKLYKQDNNASYLKQAIESVMGKTYSIRARCSAAAKEENKAQELIEKAKNSGIETAVE